MPDQPTPPQPEMPATGRSRRFGRIPRAMMVGGLTVGLALGGAGIAFAASSGSSTPSTTTPSKPTPPGPGHINRGFRGFGPGGRLGFGGVGGLGQVLHGEFTTKAGSGFRTVEVQVGKVTKVSTTSITVQSADKYSHTYAVTASTMVDAERDGIGSVAVGDQVQVLATSVNGTDTATNIVDTTKIGASRKGFGFGSRPTPGPTPAKPAPPATQSAAV
jgi:hypothetical protein